jgi:hypothetical protein
LQQGGGGGGGGGGPLKRRRVALPSYVDDCNDQHINDDNNDPHSNDDNNAAPIHSTATPTEFSLLQRERDAKIAALEADITRLISEKEAMDGEYEDAQNLAQDMVEFDQSVQQVWIAALQEQITSFGETPVEKPFPAGKRKAATCIVQCFRCGHTISGAHAPGRLVKQATTTTLRAAR